MQFRMRNAPEWFCGAIYRYYINELHEIEKAAKTIPNYTDQRFKEIAVEYFAGKDFTVWLDADNHICFDVDPNSAKWTFEILRN
jgi:hypothetical protein